MLKLESRNPLLELRLHKLCHTCHLASVAHGITREEVFRQLLRDCRATSLRLILEGDSLYGHTEQRGNIDSRVVTETHILCGNQCRHNGGHAMTVENDVARRVLREEVVVLHIRAILHEECTDDVTIVAINLGCEVALRILQFLE